MIVRPVFIFGIARGGTNLIARSLAEHRDAVVALDVLMPVLKAWRNLAYASQLPGDLLARLDPLAPFQDFYFDPDGPALLRTLLTASADLTVSKALLAELREAVVERARLEHPELADGLAAVAGETVGEILENLVSLVSGWKQEEGSAAVRMVGFKEVWTADFIPALARLFPTARFIVIHRDPRAIVTSLLAMAERDPTQKAHPISYLRHWRKMVALARHFAHDPDLAPRITQLRYEDLCQAPAEELDRLCASLEIELHETMLQPDSQWVGNSSFGPREQPIDPTAVDRWRSRIDPAMRRTVEFHCGHEMRLLGYDVEPGYDALTADIIETVRHYDRDPGKWRSDHGNWRDGLAWECMRQNLLAIQAPDDLAAIFLLEQG